MFAHMHKVQDHVSRNKTAYLCVGSAAVSAVVSTNVTMRYMVWANRQGSKIFLQHVANFIVENNMQDAAVVYFRKVVENPILL